MKDVLLTGGKISIIDIRWWINIFQDQKGGVEEEVCGYWWGYYGELHADSGAA